MKGTKPIGIYIKAMIACATLLVFGLGYSWAIPFVHVACTRHGERVECQVQRKLIGLIAYETTTIDDLQAVDFYVEQGSSGSDRIKTTDAGYLKLIDGAGVEKSFLLESGKEFGMARSESFAKGIESFLRSEEPTYFDWTVPLIGYGAIVPVALGSLFLALVTWNFLGTRWRAMRPIDATIDPAQMLRS